MKITADLIKKLRKKTKAGVMECKQALVESGGDLQKAGKWLVKKGLVKAAKKIDREMKAGLVDYYVHAGGTVGSLVKLTCETDFVARNEEFKKLAHEIAMQVAATDPPNIKVLLTEEYIRDPLKTVGDLVKEAIARLGENIRVEEIKRLSI